MIERPVTLLVSEKRSASFSSAAYVPSVDREHMSSCTAGEARQALTQHCLALPLLFLLDHSQPGDMPGEGGLQCLRERQLGLLGWKATHGVMTGGY